MQREIDEKEKMKRVQIWYDEGRDSGFTDKQLDFLKNYFAFWNDIPKQIDDLL